MRIAILGTRGIPARYGGFETFAEELSRRLAERGHSVSVYCRKHIFQGSLSGFHGRVQRVILASIRSKYLETLSHTILSVLHLIKWKVTSPDSAPQVVILCNGANAPLVPLIRILGIKVLLNVDGIEKNRRKWGKLGASWYKFGELCAVRFPNVVISDAKVISDYYNSRYGAGSQVITYGYDDSMDELVSRRLDGASLQGIEETLDKFDLVENGYILYVSRLEPENNCHILLEAYRNLGESEKATTELVIVGNAPYADEYISGLREIACRGVKFLGFQFGQTYKNLMLGARVYVQATEVGGTHPALVESMGFGNVVIANKTPENAEVLGDAGFLYDMNSTVSLAKKLKDALYLTDKRSDSQMGLSIARRAYTRARNIYSWEQVVDQYEKISSQMVQKNRG